jgi:hypothetical protein
MSKTRGGWGAIFTVCFRLPVYRQARRRLVSAPSYPRGESQSFGLKR